MTSGLLVAPLPECDIAETDQRTGLAAAIASLTTKTQGPLEMTSCTLVAALLKFGDAEAGQGSRFGGDVTGLLGGAASVAVDGDRLAEVTARNKKAVERGGQICGVPGPAMTGGVHGDCDQGR